jgi:hypothetical protein
MPGLSFLEGPLVDFLAIYRHRLRSLDPDPLGMSGVRMSLRGVFCHRQDFASHRFTRTSIAQRDGTNAPATDDDAVGELRPIATATNIRVAGPNVEHTSRIRAEDQVVVGEDFFCHGRRSLRFMPPQIEG